MGRLGDMVRRWRGGPRPRSPDGDRDAPHPDDAWPVPMQGTGDARAAVRQLEAAGMDGHPDDWFFSAATAPQPEASGGADTGTQNAPAIGGIDADLAPAEARDVDALFLADVHDSGQEGDASPVVVPEFPVNGGVKTGHWAAQK